MSKKKKKVSVKKLIVSVKKFEEENKELKEVLEILKEKVNRQKNLTIYWKLESQQSVLKHTDLLKDFHLLTMKFLDGIKIISPNDCKQTSAMVEVNHEPEKKES